MKDTMRIVAIFALVLVLLLVFAWVIEQFTGSKPEDTPAEDPAAAETEAAPLNEMNINDAAVITLSGNTAHIAGLGAEASDGGVKIVYPGTYRLTGALDDGTVTVDLGSYTGAVYLILDGASVTSTTGPAIHIAQADLTVVYLAADTQNTLSDGSDYVIMTEGEPHAGAAIYSADDLRIEGTGTLTLTGSAADGIRVKDTLTVAGGALNITAADDGIQVNDACSIEDGSLLIGAAGDGISVTRGALDMTGGHLWVNCSGDVMTALTDISISGGSLNATAAGGSTLYSYIALNDISAKGIKAETITISGGSIDLDTADDAIHASRSVVITGGSFSLSSGDDAVHAAELADIANIALNIVTCYEGVEADEVRLSNVNAYIAAENNGVDAGEGGFYYERGVMDITAPRAIGSEGILSLSGTVNAVSDGTKSPVKFVSAEISGGLTVTCTAGDGYTVLEGGELPASLLFVLPSAVSDGAEVTLTDAAGAALVSTTAPGSMYLFAGNGLTVGQTYTLTAGDETYTAVLTGGCTVTPALQERSAPGSNEMGRPS